MASEALKVNASLRTITLGDYRGGNNIGDAGAAALAEVHEQMPMQM